MIFRHINCADQIVISTNGSKSQLLKVGRMKKYCPHVLRFSEKKLRSLIKERYFEEKWKQLREMIMVVALTGVGQLSSLRTKAFVDIHLYR